MVDTEISTHPCEFACAYGTCDGASGPNPCGGCCACLGPCVIDYENAQPGAPVVAYKPVSGGGASFTDGEPF